MPPTLRTASALLSSPPIEQRIDDLLPVPEVCLFEPIHRLLQVNQAPFRGKVKDPQRAGRLESLIYGHGGAFALIDKDEVGFQGNAERNGGSLAGVQGHESGIVDIWCRDDVHPGLLFYPGLHRWRRGRMAQLLSHDRREQYLFEQLRQEIDLIDLHQVTNRTGVRDNQKHQSPRRCKPERSRSRSSRV